MRHYKYALIVFVLAILSGVLLAQSRNSNEAIPECTPEQALLLVNLVDAAGIAEQIDMTREQEQRSNYPFVQFDGYMKVWRDYDEDLKPRLPQCALALRFENSLYWLIGSEGYWQGAQTVIEEAPKRDADDFLKLDEVPGIVESASADYAAVFEEVQALAAKADGSE